MPKPQDESFGLAERISRDLMMLMMMMITLALKISRSALVIMSGVTV